jgi:RND family efflux transporter MFP subunit
MRTEHIAPLGAVVLAMTALSACGRPEARPEANPLPRQTVRIEQARARAGTGGEEVIGTVRARSSAAISTTVVGKVSALPVTLGRSVRAGDVLVRISADEIGAKVEQSEALYARAQADFERAQKLLEHDAIPKAQYDAAAADLRLARGRRAEAGAMAGHTVLRAPFDGVVTAKSANVGDTAMPGQTLLVLDDPRALRLEATVPELAARSLRKGQNVPIRLDGGRELTGVVAEISPAADPASRTVLAKVDLPADPALHPGLMGRLRLPSAEARSIVVPGSALLRRGQLEEIFVVENGRARLRLVKAGFIAGDGATEILSGLSDGESIVTSGTVGLVDGQPVEAAL